MLEDLFPRHIKAIRLKKKIRQKQLAIMLGVDVSTIRRWENGDRWPGPGDIQALAQALSVPIRELFTFPEHPKL